MPGRRAFQVRWTGAARRDLAGIVDHIAAESPDGAEAILARLEQTARRLETLPARGRIIPELKSQGIALYRELICRPWRIAFRIERRDVWIMAVVDGRRNLEDLLLQRFLDD